MDNYRLGKYKFNRRMTQTIAALVIIIAIVMGGSFRQATYTISNPVESVITITGDLDEGDQVIADETLAVHATVDDRLYQKYISGFTPVVRLISSTGSIALSKNFRPPMEPVIETTLNVISILEGTYTVQIVFDIGNDGEISDEIYGIEINHPADPVVATVSISGSDPRTGIIDIGVTVSVYPASWIDRIIVRDSVGVGVVSVWGEEDSGVPIVIQLDTTAYVNGEYTVIGEVYDLTDGQILMATDTETFTTGNEIPPDNELIANIYVKTDSGEYSVWPVVKDGTGILFGVILVEGVVTGDMPTSVYFVIELGGQELNRFVMSETMTGAYTVEFDTTTLADGNYDMLVEANFADGSSIQMSAWGFGVVPGGGGGSEISNYVIIGVAGLAVVIFIYGLKKREMFHI